MNIRHFIIKQTIETGSAFKGISSKCNNLMQFVLIVYIVGLLSACRKDEIVIYPDEQRVERQAADKIPGLYVLNEGNMGSNKATLDYLDFSTGTYFRNIYPSRNPNLIKELGDVGNDIKIYKDDLWLVINQSNKVEVASSHTAVSRGHVDIPNCRYVVFKNEYAYVSSYVGKISEKSVLGAVYKVDINTLKVVDKCIVGYQPEEMEIVGNKLYVANSGGYNPINGLPYDNTVSVINLDTFTEVAKIDVAPNLFRLRKDQYERLWVSSRGNYGELPARLYLLENERVAKEINIPIADFDFRGDSLIYYSLNKGNANFGIIDIRTTRVVNSNFIHQPKDNPIQTPYGIVVHPITGDIFLMDATNYVSSGKLYCFDSYGKYKWVTWTGDIPGHACFLKKE